MKGTHYKDIPGIELTVTTVMNELVKKELKKAGSSQLCIAAERAYSK